MHNSVIIIILWRVCVLVLLQADKHTLAYVNNTNTTKHVLTVHEENKLNLEI